jgi:hypothetical protein
MLVDVVVKDIIKTNEVLNVMRINLALPLVILPFLTALSKNLFTMRFREFLPFLAENEALVGASDLLDIVE